MSNDKAPVSERALPAVKEVLPPWLTELYPFEQHYVSIAGHRLHYVDEGHGHPVVLVHGNPTWSFYFRSAIAELRGRYRMIAPDHIGCGLSDKPSDAQYSYTLERRARDLGAFIDHLDLKEPFTLIVHDWGGMIGLHWAVRHRERIARIIVTNTAGFSLPEGRNLPPALILARLAGLSPLLVRGLNLFCEGAARLCVRRKALSRAIRRGYLFPYRTWRSRLAVHRFIQDIPLTLRDPSYAAVKMVESQLGTFKDVPRLVLWGGRDFVFDRRFLARWRELWPDADYHLIQDAGHYLMEDAWSECSTVINRFLQRTELATHA